MSRSVSFSRPGGPDVLEIHESTPRDPAAHEVRIKVAAIGINRAEAMWRVDDYIEPVTFPAGLGYEAAGTIEALGEGVTGFAVGEAVNVIPSFSMNQYGTYGDLVLVPEHAVVRQPRSLTAIEAASVWMMFVTAYGALIDDAKIGEGDFVLISAASSSVGLAAIQLANHAGATPIALTRTSAKRRALVDIGAPHVIATEEADLVEEVARITGGQGARIAFDPIGGAIFTRILRALSPGGVAYLYGALAPEPTTLPVLEMIAKAQTVKVHNIWNTSGDAARRTAAVDYVIKGLESGALKPVIDRTFTFDQIREVHRYLEANGQFGKIVVTV